MANSILGINGAGAAPVGTGHVGHSARTAAVAPVIDSQTPADVGASDVHITGTASKMASLEQMLRSMPAVDESRVAHISRAIADGSYSVSPDKIAQGLLQSERSLAQLGIQQE